MEKLKRFVNYIEVEHNYSKNTLKSYKADMLDFYKFIEALEEKKAPFEADMLTIRAYMTQLFFKKKSSATICRKISTLRCFFDLLCRDNIIAANPAKMVSLPKNDKKLPSIMSIDDILDILAMVEGGSLLSLRDRAIMELLYSSGIRVGELAGLDWQDVDLEEGMLTALGKGNKERLVPVGLRAVQALCSYRDKIVQEALSLNGLPLLLNRFGKRLSDRSIRRIISKYATRMGKFGISPHSFRHTFATHMLDGGCDIRSIQEMLGHASLSTTQRYTQVTVDKLVSTYDKHFWRNRNENGN